MAESTAITNVLVFDGTSFTGPKDIYIRDGLIEAVCDHGSPMNTMHTTITHVFDGTGKFCLPGFIDCHVHVREESQLLVHARHGVTTVLDMGCWPLGVVKNLEKRCGHGCADFMSAGVQAFAHDSRHAKNPHFAHIKPVVTEQDAVDFVAARVEEKMSFIKVIMDGSFDVSVLKTLVAEAKRAGLLSVAHATNVEAYRQAQEAGVNVLTHAPTDAPLPVDLVQNIANGSHLCVPTLVMMNAVTSKMAPGSDVNAVESVRAMHKAGIPILVGTDANEGGGSPAEVLHGAMFRIEVLLLSMAGMSLLEILRATSMDAAKHFNLKDRGAVEPQKRADLVLLGSNPLRDLAAYGRVEKVFCRGELVK